MLWWKKTKRYATLRLPRTGASDAIALPNLLPRNYGFGCDHACAAKTATRRAKGAPRYDRAPFRDCPETLPEPLVVILDFPRIVGFPRILGHRASDSTGGSTHGDL